MMLSFRSTPPHGGRLVVEATAQPPIAFRSTPPHGGRPTRRGYSRCGMGRVSIHAPARGATLCSGAWRRERSGFDPRPRTGGDKRNPPHTAASSWFRSTPPHGGRRVRVIARRAPDGVSIHAPARGATEHAQSRNRRMDVSIHAPARGATPRCCDNLVSPRGFDPRPRTGGDTRRASKA